MSQKERDALETLISAARAMVSRLDMDSVGSLTGTDVGVSHERLRDALRNYLSLRRLPDETPAQVHTATCPRCFLSFTCTGPDETPAPPPEAPWWRCEACGWSQESEPPLTYRNLQRCEGGLHIGPVVEDTGSGGETTA
jgi:hypothetical protein